MGGPLPLVPARIHINRHPRQRQRSYQRLLDRKLPHRCPVGNCRRRHRWYQPPHHRNPHRINLRPRTQPCHQARHLRRQAYTQFWYQPTYASTYASTVLRRYNGGASDGDKVKAYCAGLRGLTTPTAADARDLVAASVAGTAGVVTLTGAQALAAGAIAFGAAALAF